MTREELIARFVQQKANKTVLTWAQFVSAIGAADATTKNIILNAANSGNGHVLFTTIGEIVKQKKRDVAKVDIDAIAADNTLTIDELLTIFE